MQITAIEKRVLQNLQLTGMMGKCGALTAKQRGEILAGLLNKKLLNKNMTLTALGIELSK